jgi:hypothetical protein
MFQNLKTCNMAKIDFINQLKVLGFKPQEPTADRLYFEITVEVGSNKGKKVLVGLFVANDFPLSVPTGPHFRPLDEGWKEHPQNVNPSNFGDGWQVDSKDLSAHDYQQGWRYWSRPCPEWSTSDCTVKFYLSHIRKILIAV